LVSVNSIWMPFGNRNQAGGGEVGGSGGVHGYDGEAGVGVVGKNEVGVGTGFDGGVAGEVEGAEDGIGAAAHAAHAHKPAKGGNGQGGEDADHGNDDEKFDEGKNRSRPRSGGLRDDPALRA
jgi:hypothetical protein